MKKRILCIILVLVTVLTVIPYAASAEASLKTGSCGDALTWKLDMNTGVLTVSGTGAMKTYTFPDADALKNISPFLRYQDSIRSVVIEEGVTSVGRFAFMFCYNIESVTLPGSLRSVAYSGFSKCDKLSTVTYMGSKFQWNNIVVDKFNDELLNADLTYNPIGGDLTDTASWSFDGNTGTLVISGTGEIPDFSPRTAPWIADYQYRIFSIVVEEGITEIGKWAFSYIYYAKNLKLPSTLEKIDTSAFYRCMSLGGIALPDSLSVIGNGAFAYCKNLQSLSIPEKVARIAGYTVYDCKKLQTVYYAKTAQDWQTLPKAAGNEPLSAVTVIEQTKAGVGWSYDSDSKTLTVSGNGRMENYVAKKAPWYAHAADIEKIVVQEGVTYIGNYAFAYCSNAAEISLPSTVTYIGAAAFYKCSSITELSVPDAVTTIYSGAFYSCSKLSGINIPSGVTIIHKNTFLGCSSLTDVSYSGTAEQFAAIQILDNNTELTSATITFK